MDLPELITKIGEETIYSAKGHFKACDLRRRLTTTTIWACAFLNVLGLIGIHPSCDKWLAALGLFGTIALLIWNEGEGKNYRSKHKEAGEKYLALHKEIRDYYYLSSYTADEVKGLAKKVSEFDQSDKPEIPAFARRWAKKAIEKNDPETNNWFLEK